MRNTKGFTLIELMIAVAIVSILAAIAIPAYQNYLVRSRVTEGLLVAVAAKTLVAENATNGLPLNAGFPPLEATQNVLDISMDGTNGEITITYSAISGDGTLILAPRDGGVSGAALSGTLTNSVVPSNAISWNCNSASSTKPGTKGTLPARFSPAQCR